MSNVPRSVGASFKRANHKLRRATSSTYALASKDKLAFRPELDDATIERILAKKGFDE